MNQAEWIQAVWRKTARARIVTDPLDEFSMTRSFSRNVGVGPGLECGFWCLTLSPLQTRTHSLKKSVILFMSACSLAEIHLRNSVLVSSSDVRVWYGLVTSSRTATWTANHYRTNTWLKAPNLGKLSVFFSHILMQMEQQRLPH